MNGYDDVLLDIPRLLAEQQLKLPPHNPSARSADGLSFFGFLRSRAAFFSTALIYRMGIYRRLVYSNFKLDWFFEFADYWVNELGNRPLNPHDFYFLYSTYRHKFQALEVPDGGGSQAHLQAWQDPRTVYLLFHSQFKNALRPLVAHRYVKYIRRDGNVCEYGCGLAPLTASLSRFFPHLNLRITCADIPTLVFHFARWKYRYKPFIHMLALDPDDDEPLGEDYDTIFCMTVFEHLPRPLAIARHLHARLKPGGILVFDYLKSEGGGLDTASSARQRLDVLNFIHDHFQVIEGQLYLDGNHVGIVICQKK